MDREKPPYIPPMTGAEALDMFGDRSLLTLEEQRDRLGHNVDQMQHELVALREDPEADWEVVSKLETDLDAMRDTLARTNKEIRTLGHKLGDKRGPRTLH